MVKVYVSEEELRGIFNSRFNHSTTMSFEEWLETKMEAGEVELVEFDHYEVSGLDYKPVARLTGADSNIFNLMGIAKRALVEAGKRDKGNEMCTKIVKQAKNNDEAMLIMKEYVEVL